MSDSDRDVKRNNVLHHDDNPSVSDHVGEAAGGISGVLAGAAIGSAGGPVGTLIGGILGAMGGWWTGRAVSEAAERITHSDDDYYRTHYERSPNRLADRSYDHVRPAYHLGHLAAHNPEYQDRDWEHVERDLQKGWASDPSGRYGDWSSVRDYAREGYVRGRSRLGPIGTNAGMSTGTATGNVSGALGDAGRSLREGAREAVDSLKDAVDRNPASKPGPDPTDRRI